MSTTDILETWRRIERREQGEDRRSTVYSDRRHTLTIDDGEGVQALVDLLDDLCDDAGHKAFAIRCDEQDRVTIEQADGSMFTVTLDGYRRPR